MQHFEELDIRLFYLYSEDECNKSLSKDGKDGKDDAIPTLPIHLHTTPY